MKMAFRIFLFIIPRHTPFVNRFTNTFLPHK